MSSSFAQRKTSARWQRDLLIHDAIGCAAKMSVESRFEQLLRVACCRSNFLKISSSNFGSDLERIRTFLKGLLAVSQYGKSWIRDPETWLPVQENLRAEFRSLLEHLFWYTPVPKFLDDIWFAVPSARTMQLQKIYLHLAGGNSIRGAALPIPLSKSMARAFPHAPDHYSFEQALRWSQLQVLSADDQFRRGVMQSCLGNSFDHEPLASRMIEFFARGVDMESRTLAVVFDHIFQEGNSRRLAPLGEHPQKFSKRYTKEIQELRQLDSEKQRPSHCSWEPQPFGGFRCEETKRHDWSSKHWTIEELTTSQQLQEEGDALHHCVASYALYCQCGLSSIWSLRSHGLYTDHRELTIEVRPRTKSIVTALGRCNTSPKPEARKIMEQWAAEQDLKIEPWV